MATPYVGEVRVFSFNFPPKGWAMCDGQVMAINQNVALFSLLGTTYGGDGRQTFGLPDLRGRMPVHVGNGFILGERAGEETHTLLISELPAHQHSVTASSNGADQASPKGNYWANPGRNVFASAANSAMAARALQPAGGSQPHTNLAPCLVLTLCIALQGIFPSQN